MLSIAQEHSLFEIDQEPDSLLEAMQEQGDTYGEASVKLLDEFQLFSEVHGEKVRPHRLLHAHDGSSHAVLQERGDLSSIDRGDCKSPLLPIEFAPPKTSAPRRPLPTGRAWSQIGAGVRYQSTVREVVFCV
jgi:hypothetical protein